MKTDKKERQSLKRLCRSFMRSVYLFVLTMCHAPHFGQVALTVPMFLERRSVAPHEQGTAIRSAGIPEPEEILS